MKLLFDVMLEIFFSLSHVNKPEFAYACTVSSSFGGLLVSAV